MHARINDEAAVRRLPVPGLDLVEVAPRLRHAPTAAAVKPDDPHALYIATQGGRIERLDLRQGGELDPRPYWDFTAQVDAMRQAGEAFEPQPFRHVRYPQGFASGMGFSDERGLLGLAFDPQPPHHDLYVHLSTATDAEHVDHYATIVCVRPHAAQQSLRLREILRFPQPQFNHNGGDLVFGPHDGMLYVTSGDGGGFNDMHGRMARPRSGEPRDKDGTILLRPIKPGEERGTYFGNAQDPTVLHGKILRIDVHGLPRRRGKTAYTVPHDNPFVGSRVDDWPAPVRHYFQGTRVREEIWALGLRNPWRIAFWPRLGEQQKYRMAIADVGQSTAEELNVVDVGEGGKGLNFGWRAMEGPLTFDRHLLNLLRRNGVGRFRAPVLSYGRADGVSIIGGYPLAPGSPERLAVAFEIRRATGRLPADVYVFGDYHGRVFVGWNRLGDDRQQRWDMRELFRLPGRDIHSFARDAAGRVHVLWTESFHTKPTTDKRSGVSRIVFRPVAEEHKPIVGGDLMTMTGLRSNEVKGYLGHKTLHEIGKRALRQAKTMEAPLRRDPRTGGRVPPQMQVVVLSRPKDAEAPPERWPRHYMRSDGDDAWSGSYDVARAKAYSALAFSSDQNALTTRSLGELSQPGKALYGLGKTNLGTAGPPGSGVHRRGLGIVTFPGGVPLYDHGGTRLVGAIGVSGSDVDTDERVAVAGAHQWLPSSKIRIDTVTKGTVNYVKP